ncbi:SspB domain-containing protein [Pseudomonas phage 201phi2-1]|uniref:Uncharacterized protein n=1 Tax=Pseudomonas phage 201phi2-1 TaxID=198110 RepID=B3FJK8_BP201|nr:SspB domain-containing protein [Pseudomonas phage 201phi2-1]ABY63173.1 hypothetical protein 201phi2-1p347 [Pseudomonas phage 201phi2-1]
MSIQRITFEGVLNWLSTKQSDKWHMVFQASQFDLNDFVDSVSFGHLTLNLSPNATRDMALYDEHIYFKICKHGIPQEMMIPYTALMIIQDPDDPSGSMPWPYFLDHGEDYTPDEDEELDQGTVVKKSNVIELPNSGVKLELRIPTLEDYNNLNFDNVLQFPKKDADGELPSAEEIAELNQLMSDNGMDINLVEFKRNDKGEFEVSLSLNDNPVVEWDGKDKHLKQLSDNLPKGLVSDDGIIDVVKLASKAQRLALAAPPTLQQRMAERGMSVIIGGAKPAEASMPFIDEVYRAKRERREAIQKAADEALFKERALPAGTTLGEMLQSPGMTIRSDGSKGNSVFFPDLDVRKCYFHTRRIVRPEWLQVHEGGLK